ncbi:uncharacterized protein LY89DRAFT_682930 [Mollisia scopiformis]|uniref:Zn(2)-C6 fungal-type domain-containing protein n=1 Tax=Mollisia scopiformis TaxID=149040 RepID=A0A194XJ41_MOLSC|nr:uncharacterized protein LY89DRAFT_682930 [Mollisia scopiformis]KUJ20144.1 hypothetical protein LY89DRAFT_682930 [Mollisia scopiformis]
MPDSSPQPKKARRRGPNTKAGCDTCKIRRKRCDQTRPACLRCSSTGRTCDFLSSPRSTAASHDQQSLKLHETLYWPHNLGATLSLFQLSSKTEADHFDYFVSECTTEFAGHVNGFFWQRSVIQAAHSEPFILHALLAIGSLRRLQVHGTTPSLEWHKPEVAEYITKKYAIALQTLRQRLRDRTIDWRLAALGSLVFLAIEVLQGYEQGAIIHYQSGETIIRSLSNIFPPNHNANSFHSMSPPAGYSKDTISDDIITAFTRLSVDEELFLGVSTLNSTDLPALPTEFESMTDAKLSVNSIMSATFAFLRRNGDNILKTLPLTPIPNAIVAEFSSINQTLQQWHCLFNTFLSCANISDPLANILLIHYYVASIKISTYFYSNELIYDEYTPQWEMIIDLSSTIVTHQINLPNSIGPCFTLDIAMAQPLYFVARKCRDINLRTKAIEEMKRVGSKGVYTGKTVAKVAEWVVRTEGEQEVDEGSIPDEKRLRDVHFDFDRATRSGKVGAKRRKVDGTFEYLMEDLDLS